MTNLNELELEDEGEEDVVMETNSENYDREDKGGVTGGRRLGDK